MTIDDELEISPIEQNIENIKINHIDGIANEENLNIQNVDDLIAFQRAVNSGKTFEGYTVTLTNDIDLGGVKPTITYSKSQNNSDAFDINITGEVKNAWKPIGTFSTPFKGTFDGGGHAIKNMVIFEPETDARAMQVGFFGQARCSTIFYLEIS